MPVSYFQSDLVPNQLVFDCAPLSARLQVSTCASMWTAANRGRQQLDAAQRCRSCAVGSRHAGFRAAENPFFGAATLCCRCGRSDLRLVGDYVCVGCKNREYEWVRGRNARGKPPVSQKPLAPRSLCVRDGRGAVRVVHTPLSASTLEVMVNVLRKTPGHVAFGFNGGGVKNAG